MNITQHTMKIQPSGA